MLTPSVFDEMGRIRAASLRADARGDRRERPRRRRRDAIRAAVGARIVSAGFRLLRGVT
ncbi:MAG TPA: hypothetical protein VKB32_06880 [Actinomycetota bacterium]|nr:hypothetical protein [Actinomycetota bacterium]